MFSSKKYYTVADIERVFESGRHRSGSADLKVLEFFLEPLIRGELEDDAVLAYGSHLIGSDIRFIAPFVDAMSSVLDRNPEAVKKLRLRPGLSFPGLSLETRRSKTTLYEVMLNLGERLRNELPPESRITPRILELVRKLDAR